MSTEKNMHHMQNLPLYREAKSGLCVCQTYIWHMFAKSGLYKKVLIYYQSFVWIHLKKLTKENSPEGNKNRDFYGALLQCSCKKKNHIK